MTQPVRPSDSGKLPTIKTAGLRHLTEANSKGEVQSEKFLLMSESKINLIKKVIAGDPNLKPDEKKAIVEALDLRNRLIEQAFDLPKKIHPSDEKHAQQPVLNKKMSKELREALKLILENPTKSMPRDLKKNMLDRSDMY